MNKKPLLVGLALVFVSGLAISPIWAKGAVGNQATLTRQSPQFFSFPAFASQNLPERNGIFSVPGRPDLKVRVYVHRVKPPRSTSTAMVCGLPDLDSTALVGSTGWRLPGGNWTYTLNSASVPASVGSSSLAIMAADAFSRWSGAMGATSTVVFSRSAIDTTKGKAGLDGSNVITWGRISGTALGITYVWYSRTTGLVAEVDTVLNLKFPWSWSNPANWTGPETTCADQNAYDAQGILTHELGHWLGLNDFYTAEYQNATMYGYGAKGEIKDTTLSTGDINGARAIYR